VRSPFHSEPEAFRSLFVLILALVPVVLAAVLGPAWLALVVLAVVVGGVAARAAQVRMRKLRTPDLPVKMAPPHLGSATERRVLVVANDTLSEEALRGEIDRLVSAPHTQVLLLVPAVVTLRARLTGAIDSRLDQAQARMRAALDGVGNDNVSGKVTGEPPLEAIEDTFATFVPDEVIVATRWDQTADGLEPRLAGLVRERFAVPVRHLVFEPGSAAEEPDERTEARYQREFGEAAARKFGLGALAGAAIVAALAMSVVAVARTGPSSATTTVTVANPAPSTPPTSGPSASAKVIDLTVIASGKKGPDGKLHDDFTVTDFHVTVGQPLTLRIDNTDTVPHSITSPEAGVNIIVSPGTHDYTLLVHRAGTFEWHCVFPCDPWSMTHIGYMRGVITATAA
jgi:hypothetical protein